MNGIQNITKPRKLKLFLALPTKSIISPLKHASNKLLTIKQNESNELSFSLPYEITRNHQIEKYKPVSQLKEKYLIKAVSGDEVEWFEIVSYSKSTDNSDEMAVKCYSYENQLSRKKLIDFHVTSHNLIMTAEKVLEGTGWKVDYINPKFNLQHREFDISSTTKLSFLYQDITETFEGSVPIFDTVNKTVSYYEKDELSQYKGFSITEKKYLQDIEQSIDSSEVVTRLHVTGADGLGIQSVNPTGQRYIDDFSYFLYPFEMDENGKVIKHSDFMPDDLAITLVNYNKYVSSRKDEFGNYLKEKREKQEQLTIEDTVLFNLETELKMILDSITWMKNRGESTSDLARKRNAKNKEIKEQKEKIKKLQSEIELIDESIGKLGEDLKMEKHFSPTQLEELQHFIHEDEWTDENKIDPNDLYEAGLERLSEINSPPLNLKIGMVNFLEVVEAKHDWDRFHVGDIVRIVHKKLGITVKANLISIQIDYETPSIDVEISNLKELNDIQSKLTNGLYTIEKVSTDYNKRKINWNTAAKNFNLRNDRIKETPIAPTTSDDSIVHDMNDNGTVDINLYWEYPDWKETEKNSHNIDGFLIYLYSDKTDEPYQFTSQMSKETVVDIHSSIRSYTFPSLPPNLFYTIGIRSYRRVDEDINRDGIIMSDIARFKGAGVPAQGMLSTFSQIDDDNSPMKPYRPSDVVDFRGTINGLRINGVKPQYPSINDVWFNPEKAVFERWDGNDWVSDKEMEEYKKKVEDFEEQVGNIKEDLQNEIEESKATFEEAMKSVDEEFVNIHEGLLPEIEQSIKETIIPSYDTPPDEPPASGLYWDTSQEPPRMMRWDGDKWVVLAPTGDEIQQMMTEMRNQAVSDSIVYSKATVMKVRKNLQERITDEVGQATESIQELLDVKDELIESANTIDEKLNSYNGRFTEFEQTIDEFTGIVSTSIEEIERIDGIVQGHTSEFTQIAEAIEAKVGSIEYQQDKQGIIESIEANTASITAMSEVIELSVTREEFDTVTDDYEERIASTEGTLRTHAGLIEAKAEKTELINYVDKQTYQNEVGSFTVGTGTIAGRVEATEIEFRDFKTQEYANFKQQYTEFIAEVDRFQTRVGILSDDGDTLVKQVSDATQTANSIKSTIESIEIAVGDDLESYMVATKTTIEQLPDQINLVVSEGINNLEIGGRNLIPNSEFKNNFSGWGRLSGDITVLSETYKGLAVARSYDPSDAGSARLETDYIEIEPSQDYTLSFYGKQVQSTGGVGNRIYFYDKDKNQTRHENLPGFPAQSDWEKREHTFTTESNEKYILIWFGYYWSTPTGEFLFTSPKLEIGNKATDWSPAPGDLVDKTNILSSINLSTEGVRIQGNKIDIAGLVTVLNNDGSAGTMISGDKLINNSVTTTQLNVDQIFGNNAVISKIQSDIVSTTKLNADNINAGTIRGLRMEGVTGTFTGSLANFLDGSSGKPVTAVELKQGYIGAMNINEAHGWNSVLLYEKGNMQIVTIDTSRLPMGWSGIRRDNVRQSITDVLATKEKGITIKGDYIRFDNYLRGEHSTLEVLDTGLELYSTKNIRLNTVNQVEVDAWDGLTVREVMRFRKTGHNPARAFIENYENLRGESASIGFPVDLTVDFRDITLAAQSNIYLHSRRTWTQDGVVRESIASIELNRLGDVKIKGAVDVTGNVAITGNFISTSGNVRLISEDGNATIRAGGGSGTIYMQGEETRVVRNGTTSTYRPLKAAQLYSINYNSYGSSSNMYMGTSGQIYRVSSNRDSKIIIESIKVDPYNILEVNPKDWYDRYNAERYADLQTRELNGETVNYEGVEPIRRLGGLIAEEVEEVGLGQYVDYNLEGKPVGLHYDRLWTLLIPITRDHENKLTSLEAENQMLKDEIQMLKARITRLEEERA